MLTIEMVNGKPRCALLATFYHGHIDDYLHSTEAAPIKGQAIVDLFNFPWEEGKSGVCSFEEAPAWLHS